MEIIVPFCPKCGYEYREEISECFDCGSELVASLPEQRLPNSDWVMLKRFRGTVFAEMACDVLHQHGIPTLAQNHFLTSAIGSTGTGFPGQEVMVYVREEDYPEALELIAGMTGDHT